MREKSEEESSRRDLVAYSAEIGLELDVRRGEPELRTARLKTQRQQTAPGPTNAVSSDSESDSESSEWEEDDEEWQGLPQSPNLDGDDDLPNEMADYLSSHVASPVRTPLRTGLASRTNTPAASRSSHRPELELGTPIPQRLTGSKAAAGSSESLLLSYKPDDIRSSIPFAPQPSSEIIPQRTSESLPYTEPPEPLYSLQRKQYPPISAFNSFGYGNLSAPSTTLSLALQPNSAGPSRSVRHDHPPHPTSFPHLAPRTVTRPERDLITCDPNHPEDWLTPGRSRTFADGNPAMWQLMCATDETFGGRNLQPDKAMKDMSTVQSVSESASSQSQWYLPVAFAF